MTVWLITGADGMLGRLLTGTLRAAGHTVYPAGRDVDITHPHWWPTALDADVVVNCAAATDVDRCETDPVYAYRTNTVGAGNVALTCAQRGVPLIHVSTDHVFAGVDGRWYDEQSATVPVNRYGASKLTGEMIVLGAHAGAVVVRTAWLHDGPRPMPSGRHTFASWVASLTCETQPLPHQVGNPTWATALSERLTQLGCRLMMGMPDGAERVFHAVGAGPVTKIRYAEIVAYLAGVPTRFVPAPPRTDRPVHTPLTQHGWDSIGMRPMPSVLTQLEAAFAVS
jgi:dTDP-4-dehydrorhamnose reductase